MSVHRGNDSVQLGQMARGLRYRIAVRTAPFESVHSSDYLQLLRGRVLQPFTPIDWQFSDAAVSAGLDPTQPAVDFLFPRPAVVEQGILLTPGSTKRFHCLLQQGECTENLSSFGSISTARVRLKRLMEHAQVSDNLLVPLRRARVDGKVYESRSERQEETHALKPVSKPTVHRDKDGFRKSHSITKSKSVTVKKLMQIWDVVLPLLLPPLSLDFSDLMVLPNDLYPYQVDGVKFLAESSSALLGDDMGTGKTIQTIVAMRMLFQKGSITSALIIVPLTLLRNWDRELFKWAEPLSGVTVVRGSRDERAEQWQQLAHIYIATFGTIRNDLEHIIEHRHFDLVVVDEIQAIKNRGTAQTKAIKKLLRKRSWGLSGTPIENRIEDLVSIFEFLKPGLLPIEGTNANLAKQRIKPFFLRRRKSDVLKDLPEKQAFDIWLDLEDEQRAVYEDAKTRGVVKLKKLGEAVTVKHILQLLTILKQLCNRDPVSEKSCKLEYLKLKLDDGIPEDCKALVFTQFIGEGLEFVAKQFEKLNPALVHGKVSGTARDHQVDRFQMEDECRLFIATPKSGGVGLNLVRGNFVFHFDHWWNPATARQAEDRAHRIGQTRDVQVFHLWTSGTVEERIYQILESKQKLYDDVIDEMSNVEMSGLSESELFGLFDLRAPTRK